MRKIVFAAVPPIQILDLTGPFEVFARCGGYQVQLVTPAPRGRVTSSCGLTLCNAEDYRTLRGPIDTLVVPGGDGAEALVCAPDFVRWLAKTSRRARRTCAVCTGAFLLAAAGILDSRRAVTHWNWCDRLARRFPAVQVETDPIYVKDDCIYTSAGVTAGIDLALALVEEDHGRERARTIAQDLVLFLRRAGGQSQFSGLLSAQASSRQPIEDLQSWALDHLREELSVETLAARCGMSPRHFARVFSKEKRVTPARFIEQLRVSAARVLLEDSAWSMKEVAMKTGFGSADSMRRSFVRVLGMSPKFYVEACGARANVSRDMTNK